MRKNRSIKITFGGLFAALFFMSGNILPPIQFIPGVPVTLQNLVIALSAAVLGFGGGMLVLLTVFLLTAVGVPMMAGLTGGLSVFWKPTAGYMLGWIFLSAAVGLYSDFISPGIRRLPRGRTIDFILFISAGNIGVLAQYFCGALFLSVYNGAPETAGSLFFASLTVFGIFDALKIALTYILAAAAVRVFPKVFSRESDSPNTV